MNFYRKNFRSFEYLRNLSIRRILRDTKEAIKGSEQDYTEGSLRRALFLLSVPMVLEMVMESLFAIADIFFVSKLGSEAVATVGLTESLITIVYAVSFGFSAATTALVSRRIGEKRPEEASNVAFQSIIIGIAVSFLIAIPGIFWAKEMLSMMGASPIIVNEMHQYTSIMIGSNIIIMLLFIINAVFRSAGDASVAMKVLIIANVANIILDPILIFGLGPIPALGVKGAAIATVFGRGLAVLLQIYFLLRGSKHIRLMAKSMKIRLDIIAELLKLSIGGIGQNIIATSSWVGLMKIMAAFGSEALAGYTIAIRVVIFSMLPSWGLSNAASTLVGQNLGAEKPERAEKAVKFAAITNFFLLGSIGVIFIIFAPAIIVLFNKEPLVVEKGIEALRIVSLGLAFYGLGMVMMNALNGAGDTITPTKLNFLCFWMIEIPLAWIFAMSLDFKEEGVFYAIVIAESILSLLTLWWFSKGKWKEIKV